MNTILLASRNDEQTLKIRRSLAHDFNINSIKSKDEYTAKYAETDLILLDQDFTDFQGLDFLMDVVSKTKVPVLSLTEIEDPKGAAEAIRSGAFNFIVKSENYEEVLSLAITEGIKHFKDQEKLTQDVTQLKGRVKELETDLVSVKEKNSKLAAAVSHANKNAAKATSTKENEAPVADTPKDTMTNNEILVHVVQCLKSGDISLPAYPAISVRFKELIQSGAVIKEITGLLSKDPSISSKMISVANSPLYRGMVPIKTLEDAISRIGLSETRNYVELISNRSVYMAKSTKYKEFLQDLWTHSLASAFAAQEICKTLLKGAPAELFAMGLFHDIGKLLLTQVISKLENDGKYPSEIKNDQFMNIIESSHGKFGECLIKRWKMGPIVEDIVRHADNINKVEEPSEELYMIDLADKVAKSLGYGEDLKENFILEEYKSAIKLDINSFQLETIKKAVSDGMQAGLVV